MKNLYEIRGELTVIFLNRRDGTLLETVIDTNDLALVNTFPNKWCAEWNPKTKSYYVIGSIKRKTVRLHRWLLNPTSLVDHKNHDTLDNRRLNLAEVSNAENMQNMKNRKHKGISYEPTMNRWRVRQMVNGIRINHGYFETYEKAVEKNVEVRG